MKGRMSKDIQVSVSILCADFTRLAEEVRRIEASGADRIHVDVMDGHFVAPITMGDLIVKAVRPLTRLIIEAHLMIDHPASQIENFARAGADVISVHAECYGPRSAASAGFGRFPKEIVHFDREAARRDLSAIRALGKKAVLVFNPATPVTIDGLIDVIDGVLIMSVNPGFAHQKFMPAALGKVDQAARLVDEVAIDGGINDVTGAEAVKAGATVLATASYFFASKDPQRLVKGLKALGDSH